jgi:hypothetical protein
MLNFMPLLTGECASGNPGIPLRLWTEEGHALGVITMGLGGGQESGGFSGKLWKSIDSGVGYEYKMKLGFAM